MRKFLFYRSCQDPVTSSSQLKVMQEVSAELAFNPTHADPSLGV